MTPRRLRAFTDVTAPSKKNASLLKTHGDLRGHFLKIPAGIIPASFLRTPGDLREQFLKIPAGIIPASLLKTLGDLREHFLKIPESVSYS